MFKKLNTLLIILAVLLITLFVSINAIYLSTDSQAVVVSNASVINPKDIIKNDNYSIFDDVEDADSTPTLTPTKVVKDKFNTDAKNLIEKYEKSGADVIEVYVHDLNQDVKFQYNDEQKLTSASLYKLFVLWQVQEDIGSGRIKDDTKLTLTAKEDASAEDGFKLTDIGSQITVAYAKEKMIINSNNTAALMLAHNVGWSNIQKTLIKYGYKDTFVQPTPITTAADVSKFYEDLLNKKLSSTLKPEDYDSMINLLKRQKIRTNLSSTTPKDAVFAHKTGNLADLVHDAGIVFMPDGNKVIITIMTKGNLSNDYKFLKDFGNLVWNDFVEK